MIQELKEGISECERIVLTNVLHMDDTTRGYNIGVLQTLQKTLNRAQEIRGGKTSVSAQQEQV